MKKIIFIAVLITTFFSCKVQFMPSNSAGYIKQATDLNYYLDSVMSIGNNCDSSTNYDVDCNDYSRFKTGYELGEVYVNNLVASYTTLDKGAWLKNQASLIKELYDGIYAYHAKAIVLSPQSIYAFKKQIDTAIEALIISEQSLNVRP